MRAEKPKRPSAPPYLQDHLGAIVTAVLGSTDVLARRGSTWQSTFWTRGEEDARALLDLVTTRLDDGGRTEWRRDFEVELVQETDEEADGARPRWGVALRWTRPAS